MTDNFDLLETIERINKEYEQRDRIAKKIWPNLPVDRHGRKIVEGSRAEKAYNELKEAHIIN